MLLKGKYGTTVIQSQIQYSPFHILNNETLFHHAVSYILQPSFIVYTHCYHIHSVWLTSSYKYFFRSVG